jgi:hypothetical protein
MAAKKSRIRSPWELIRRIGELEDEVQECRQLNLKLAELCDVMMELVLPVNQRDETAIAEIVERYRRDVGGFVGSD